MGILHDKIADKVADFLIENKTFGNRYRSTNLPIFPKPDIVLLGLSKEPKAQIAFEVKPPHAVKREYLTGLGQTISYLLTFPLVYIVLPLEVIDGVNIPKFIKNIIEKSDLKAGIIGYNIATYEPKIIKKAELEKKIDIKRLEEKIISLRPRSWLFWMDTSLEELGQMLMKISEIESRQTRKNLREIMLDEYWQETLKKRYPNTTRPASFKLNYQLLLDTLNLWTGNGKMTVLGNRLSEICKKYGSNSNEFKDALHYVILTEGGYLKILVLIDKIQGMENFELKGSTKKLNKSIKQIRDELKIDGMDYEAEKEDVLPIYEKRAENCWYKILGVKLFKMGYGRSLTQLNEELKRRFGPYFQKQMKTDFFLNDQYIRGKGYIINWERILDLIDRGEKNLDIF
ncbi:MAG: hypothetical protein GF311_12180 [Candidatus Lokiarchaeota archaeon]|nr:hypothetical protein [Candidatus Lokiarchaeota archaeon]